MPESMIQAAAEALAKKDGFNFPVEVASDYLYDARTALEAAGVPALLVALNDAAALNCARAPKYTEPRCQECTTCRARAAYRKATGTDPVSPLNRAISERNHQP